MEHLEELRQEVKAMTDEADKFFNANNKAAGTRARKHLQEIKKIAQKLRVAIQEAKETK